MPPVSPQMFVRDLFTAVLVVLLACALSVQSVSTIGDLLPALYAYLKCSNTNKPHPFTIHKSTAAYCPPLNQTPIHSHSRAVIDIYGPLKIVAALVLRLTQFNTPARLALHWVASDHSASAESYFQILVQHSVRNTHTRVELHVRA